MSTNRNNQFTFRALFCCWIKPIFFCLFLLIQYPFCSFAQVCSGNLGSPIFTETFGVGIRADLNTTSSGTTSYCYEDGTGSDCVADTNSYMTDNEATLYSGNPQDLNIFWVTGGDHTGDSNGMMAVFNADFEPNEFYRLEVGNLCGGTVFEFAAWIANLYDPMNTPGPCFDNDGDGLYPNVTFEIRNPFNNALIASISTGNVLPTTAEGLPNNIQWKQFGLVFEMPIGLSTIDIVMRNNGEGGCGNDLAIDDITLRTCGPISTIRQETVVICSNSSAVFTANISDGFTDPYILWEIWTANTPIWQPLNFSGPASQGFDQIELSDLSNGDSIRFFVAGDEASINNPNCFSTSEILVVNGVIEWITPVTDTILFELISEEDNIICIGDFLELQGNITEIIICAEPEGIEYHYNQQEGEVCIHFNQLLLDSGEDEFCIIVCDDFECLTCDTTYIQLFFDRILDTSDCFIPNFISPNQDGLNDVFYINCLEEIDDAVLKVYNRWGNQVFESQDYQNNWNGTYKSEPLPDGTYFFVLQYILLNGEKIDIAGDITILR
jgi:gliding motility-associated-like protein